MPITIHDLKVGDEVVCRAYHTHDEWVQFFKKESSKITFDIKTKIICIVGNVIHLLVNEEDIRKQIGKDYRVNHYIIWDNEAELYGKEYYRKGYWKITQSEIHDIIISKIKRKCKLCL